jgi:hypothetical protein
MANIIENIGNALQAQALPAVQKFQTIVSEVMTLLGEKAEKMAREINKPPPPSRGREIPQTEKQALRQQQKS